MEPVRKEKKVKKKPLKEPDFAASGESPESRIQLIHLTAPQNKRAIQHRRPRHMAGSGRKQHSGFSSQGLIPLQHLLVTWLLPVVITVPVYLRCWLFIDWECRESW